MEPLKPEIYRPKVVDAVYGLAKASRSAWQDPKSPQYDPTWPLPIKLSARSVGYIVAEVEAWIASRPRAGVVNKAEE